MKIKINRDERVIFLGASGFGKTVLAKHFLKNMTRVLVVDPKHTFKLDGFRLRRNLPTLSRDFRLIYRPRPFSDLEDEALAHLLYNLYKLRDVLIYCDELSTLAERFPQSTKVLEDIARTGRERRVALWNAVQRPRWTPRIFFTEAETAFIFNLRSGEDRDYISKFYGDSVFPKLQKYYFYYTRDDEEGINLMTLDLDNSRIIIP